MTGAVVPALAVCGFVTVRMLYQMFIRLTGWMVLPARLRAAGGSADLPTFARTEGKAVCGRCLDEHAGGGPPRNAAELRLTLLDALGQLSPRDRAIIVLRYWEDHSIQTVSELLDLSPGVVKVQSMRALARLRTLLGEDEAPPPLPPEPGARDALPRPPVARSRP